MSRSRKSPLTTNTDKCVGLVMRTFIYLSSIARTKLLFENVDRQTYGCYCSGATSCAIPLFHGQHGQIQDFWWGSRNSKSGVFNARFRLATNACLYIHPLKCTNTYLSSSWQRGSPWCSLEWGIFPEGQGHLAPAPKSATGQYKCVKNCLLYDQVSTLCRERRIWMIV